MQAVTRTGSTLALTFTLLQACSETREELSWPGWYEQFGAVY